MSATPSTMLPLGTKAPSFILPDTVTGKDIALEELKSDKATVIMFICNHCPYVKHILPVLVDLTKEYASKGISFIAISSNDVENYPEDSPEKMKELAKQFNFSFPYLYDQSQEAARNYQAACTPDFYIFDKDVQLIYRGQFDGSRPGNNIQVTGHDIKLALDQHLAGKEVFKEQIPSIGCNIKWKK
ncbi:MAG: thioredoxin family protein [Bacillota bacterium]